MHEEGVWALAMDEDFQTIYSGGRDRKVYATELNQCMYFLYILLPLSSAYTCTCIPSCTCMYVHVCMYMYVCTCMYVHVHIFSH